VSAEPARFAAIVLAGERTGSSPVAAAAGVAAKALAPVGGRAMILRVLDALAAARDVGSIMLCGPPREVIERAPELQRRIASGEVGWVESQSTPSLSAHQAMRMLAPDTPVLLTTADHPLLTQEMVDYFASAARAASGDVVLGLARFDAVSAAFPQSRRTVLRLRDAGYCGCNLFAFLTARGREVAALWRQVEQDRKRPWRMVRIVGWAAVVRYLMRRMTLADGLALGSRRLGLRIGAVILPFPEAAVDVDSVGDWKLAEAIVSRR
jgi:GTP:adenosylcobinamide-phosphate guanylyltransferase